jgi:hypothetical protein
VALPRAAFGAGPPTTRSAPRACRPHPLAAAAAYTAPRAEKEQPDKPNDPSTPFCVARPRRPLGVHPRLPRPARMLAARDGVRSTPRAGHPTSRVLTTPSSTALPHAHTPVGRKISSTVSRRRSPGFPPNRHAVDRLPHSHLVLVRKS